VASFDRSVPPGGEGKITVRIKTKGYHGALRKKIKIFSNDPASNPAIVSLQVNVKIAVFVSPRYVNLYAREGEAVSSVISIKAMLNRPLELTLSQFDLTGKVTYRVEEVKKGKHFNIHFTSVPASPHVYQGYLKFKTNYPEHQEIAIRIRGRIVHKQVKGDKKVPK
jgi:hypothetical protein